MTSDNKILKLFITGREFRLDRLSIIVYGVVMIIGIGVFYLK